MITSSFEIITPEKARDYLGKNLNNYRSLNKSKVHAYAEDMRSGKWYVNGESISFGADGTLKNGQHRLNAIIEANKPIMCLVVRGVDENINMFDSGMTRTSGQIAKAEGYPMTNDGLGAVRILLAGFNETTGKAMISNYSKEHYDDLKTATHIVRYGDSHSVGRRASCVLAVYVCRKLKLVNDEILQDFFWVFNQQITMPNQMRDPSPALVSAKQFLLKLNSGSGTAQKKQFSVIMQALLDFKKNKNRRKEYQTESDTTSYAYLDHVREMDGIEKREA